MEAELGANRRLASRERQNTTPPPGLSSTQPTEQFHAALADLIEAAASVSDCSAAEDGIGLLQSCTLALRDLAPRSRAPSESRSRAVSDLITTTFTPPPSKEEPPLPPPAPMPPPAPPSATVNSSKADGPAATAAAPAVAEEKSFASPQQPATPSTALGAVGGSAADLAAALFSTPVKADASQAIVPAKTDASQVVVPAKVVYPAATIDDLFARPPSQSVQTPPPMARADAGGARADASGGSLREAMLGTLLAPSAPAPTAASPQQHLLFLVHGIGQHDDFCDDAFTSWDGRYDPPAIFPRAPSDLPRPPAIFPRAHHP